MSAIPAPKLHPWHIRAPELADWAFARLFVRTDRYGGYYVENGETKKCARPARGAEPNALTREVLLRHFRATDTSHVVGGYFLTPDGADSRGRIVAADIDAHEGTDADPERNERYARHLHAKLVALGFRPLLATWGGGSYHLLTLFDRDIPGAVLHTFGRWLVADCAAFGFPAPVETFPKQREVPPGKYGNWLRAVGRHHTRDAWALVFDGTHWLEGGAAVAHVLSLSGDSPDLIPAEARRVPPAAPAPRTAPSANGSARHTGPLRPGDDVFAAYNPTLDDVVAWLESRGHTVANRSADRVTFSRAGKSAGGESFNVKLIDGTPITFNFSANAGLPELKALNPAQLRCFLMFGATDKAAMGKLANVLKEEMGWGKAYRPAEAGEKRETSDGRSYPASTGASATVADAPVEKPEENAETAPETDAEAEPATLPFTGTVAPEPNPQPRPGAVFTDTDIANGRRFVADHGDNVRFVADWGRWAAFDGRRWVVDRSETLVEALAKKTADWMAHDAAEAVGRAARAVASASGDDLERAKAALGAARADLSHAKKSADMRALKRMLQAARSEPAICVPKGGDVFDARRDLLNCPNGTVELRTGTIRQHRREDFLTRLCPTAYNPTAPKAGYLEFLNRVYDGKPAVAKYVRALTGYAVTGEVTDDSLHIFSGDGSNGKSVAVALWSAVLGEGEYFHTAPADLLLTDGQSQRHPTEKTGLRGARMVVCSETDEDRFIDEAKVKSLTGRETVSARYMRGDYFQFMPTHKLVLLTNYKPKVKGTDHGIWRRLRLVPHDSKFWKESDKELDPKGEYLERFKADTGLTDRLRETECEGILADMVAHAVLFYASGKLDPPPEVSGATTEYRQDQDIIGQFFAARVRDDINGPGVKSRDLYKAFVEWWENEGHNAKRAPSNTKFGKIAKRKFKSHAPKGVVYFVRLLDASEGSEGSDPFPVTDPTARAQARANAEQGSEPSEPSDSDNSEYPDLFDYENPAAWRKGGLPD